MNISYGSLQNTAVSGFVIEKVYDTEDAMNEDNKNISIGHYVLVKAGNAVYQRVWRPSSGEFYEFITSLNLIINDYPLKWQTH